MLESIILGMVSDNDFTGYDIKKADRKRHRSFL